MTVPTPKQIDDLIAEYAAAKGLADTLAEPAKKASDAAGEIKLQLTEMVEAWGARHTEKSKRLIGLRNTATTTTATRVTIVDAAVDKLRAYLETTETPELAAEFFVPHVSYSLVSGTGGPAEKLKSLTVPQRLRKKIATMIQRCFEVKTSAPSLKVELAEVTDAA